MEKQKFNNRFGKFVAQKRVELNLTQSELAAKIGNNPQNISRLERGEVNPTLYWTAQLAKAFEISLSDLVTEFESFK